MPTSAPSGRVVQVNVSPGGLPKLPVESAWVGRLGLDGDAHNSPTVHGGPHRAVCLFAIEVIERLQAEGHPIEPGGAGENLTTLGIEWSLLPVGTRARIGDELEIELASSTTPCDNQVRNFRDGDFSRILIDRHPSDSRMYARVLREGEVRPGDPIAILAPAADSRAEDDLLIKRLERASTRSALASWRAAAEVGYGIDILEDGELAMSASAELTGPAFNQANGLARLPNMLRAATDFYDHHATPGWLWLAEEPWPGAEKDIELDLLGGSPTAAADVPPPDGVTVRRLGPDEAELYTRVHSDDPAPGGLLDGAPNPWPAVYERLGRTNARQLFIAEIDGIPVGNASLHVTGKVGWLRGALTAPEVRGRGIQSALISARVKAAAESGCDLVGATAGPDGSSARNLERLGLRRLARRVSYIYRPDGAKR